MTGVDATQAELDRFRAAIARNLGLHFDDGKLGFLAQVLSRRTGETRQRPLLYVAELEAPRAPPEELRALARELTVGETFFFRNIEQFRVLETVVLPERAAARAPTALRLLSAGCASGEEPYSLAIVAGESAAVAAREVSIRAVDVNPAALDRAAGGRYSSWALRETPASVQARYFRADGRDQTLDSRVRSKVAFEERNLIEDDPAFWQPGTFDVVFCRNVLMYFAPDTARAVVARIARSLAPGGYLFLGYAETLRGLSHEFHLRHTHGTFYYQRRTGGAAAEIDTWQPPDVATDAPPAVIADGSWFDTILRASERVRELTAPPDAPAATDAAARTAGAPPPAARPSARPDLTAVTELMKQERFVEARRSLAALATDAARDADALLLRAVLSTHGGDLATAERLCEHVLRVDELSAGAHYLTALCREGTGDHRGAADHDRAAAHLDPEFAMPRLHLGLLARRAGDADAARRELAEAVGLLAREDPARLLLFGGGFSRDGLIALCRAELAACGDAP